jgi:hypothetical protein
MALAAFAAQPPPVMTKILHHRLRARRGELVDPKDEIFNRNAGAEHAPDVTWNFEARHGAAERRHLLRGDEPRAFELGRRVLVA